MRELLERLNESRYNDPMVEVLRELIKRVYELENDIAAMQRSKKRYARRSWL